MELRTARNLLIKLFPFYFAILIIWQYVGLSHFYHRIIAEALGLFYTLLDADGPVKAVRAKGGEFVVRLLLYGKKMTLNIIAEDITSNTAMLFAIYLASPIRPFVRRFLVFFLISILMLYSIHLITVASAIRYALMSDRDVLRMYPPTPLILKLVPLYKNFYELIGMYLFILALWFPYIGNYLIRSKRSLPRS